MPVCRCGRLNWRILLVVALALFVCFGLLHWQPVRDGLEALVPRLKGTTPIKHAPAKPVSTRHVAKRKECPEDFRNDEGNFVHITVKTTQQFHVLRLQLLLSTWIAEAIKIKGKRKESLVKVSVVSDAVDDLANAVLGGRMIKSRCPSSHNRTDLCCKQATEFDLYFAEKKPAKWYCHFDDDNYVHIYNLMAELEKHDAKRVLYLGKSSRTKAKLKNVISSAAVSGRLQHSVVFQFATGGAGFCLTRPAMLKMKAQVSRSSDGKGLEGLCRKLPGLADDVAVGYVAAYNSISLTEIPALHSHLEKLSLLKQKEIQEAITLSYTRYRSYDNTVRLSSFFTTRPSDPSRLLSLHDFLKPKDCAIVVR